MKVGAEGPSSPFDGRRNNVKMSKKGQQQVQAPTAVERGDRLAGCLGLESCVVQPPLPLLKPSCSPFLKSQCTPVKLGHRSETSGARLTSNMLAPEVGTTSGFRGAFTL